MSTDFKSNDEKKIPFESSVLSVDEVKTLAPDLPEEDNKLLVALLNEFNGAYEATAAGVGAMYISKAQFWHVVMNGEAASTDPKVQVAEMFHNWKALGKGKAAVYGAAIRWAARNLVDLERECVKVAEAKIKAEDQADFKTFIQQWKRESINCANLAKQFPSIIAMQGACLVTISHHWDSNNLKPWKSILQTLGHADTLDEGEFRPVFYLATHPIPLKIVESFREAAASGKDDSIVNSVQVRARCIPATAGAFMVCAAAIPDVRGEKFYKSFEKAFGDLEKKMVTLSKAVRSDPASYSPLATQFGKERLQLELEQFKALMIFLAGYIYQMIQGTLAKAASLKKFANANARQVQRWRDLLEKEAEKTGDTLQEEFNKIAGKDQEDEKYPLPTTYGSSPPLGSSTGARGPRLTVPTSGPLTSSIASSSFGTGDRSS
jgi:hypothetical protein